MFGSLEEGDKQSAGAEVSTLPVSEETFTIVGEAAAVVEVDPASDEEQNERKRYSCSVSELVAKKWLAGFQAEMDS